MGSTLRLCRSKLTWILRFVSHEVSQPSELIMFAGEDMEGLDTVKKGTPLYGQPDWWGDSGEGQAAAQNGASDNGTLRAGKTVPTPTPRSSCVVIFARTNSRFCPQQRCKLSCIPGRQQ